uniref:Sodium/calcium exchanger membrane region domain-containing protein n=1 Tax=Kalanchoe fedtschenkoi TaxID=63787 RepID=A0A7N0TTN0_KALFE
MAFMFIKSCAISLTILSTFIFFILRAQPRSQSQRRHLSGINDATAAASYSCSDIFQIPPHDRCAFSHAHCHADSDGIIDYLSLHFCTLSEAPSLSLPALASLLFLHFYILVKTAQDSFSPVVTTLSLHLQLSPSMAAVTLLALGNGAPDVFASLAAVRGGHARTGFGAILSAGTFVSALVVGFVAIVASPFPLTPATFVRDVLFYLIAASFLFSVYLTGEIFLWQAVAFVAFYLFFVGFVFWMDLGIGDPRGKTHGVELPLVPNGVPAADCEMGDVVGNEQPPSWCSHIFTQILRIWETPVAILLKLTIPQTKLSEWNRFYLSANIALCPLALLYSCKSFMPMDHPIAFLLPNSSFPLWFVVLLASSSLALLHYILEREPPKTEQIPVVIVAFIMSVFWISTAAGELLNCLTAIGALLKLPSAILGLTVLAWGNSMGDLVADVAVAKAGQPAIAMAGCFAGPMFNMLVGLGTALVIQTANVYPEAYKLHFHTGIVVAFVFLLLSLMGSLLVITWSRFRVPRFWGFCLVGLYAVFTVISLLIARISG